MTWNTKGKALEWKKQPCLQACSGIATAIRFPLVEWSPTVGKGLHHILETNSRYTKVALEVLSNKQSIRASKVMPDASKCPLMFKDSFLPPRKAPVVPLPCWLRLIGNDNAFHCIQEKVLIFHILVDKGSQVGCWLHWLHCFFVFFSTSPLLWL